MISFYQMKFLCVIFPRAISYAFYLFLLSTENKILFWNKCHLHFRDAVLKFIKSQKWILLNFFHSFDDALFSNISIIIFNIITYFLHYSSFLLLFLHNLFTLPTMDMQHCELVAQLRRIGKLAIAGKICVPKWSLIKSWQFEGNVSY